MISIFDNSRNFSHIQNPELFRTFQIHCADKLTSKFHGTFKKYQLFRRAYFITKVNHVLTYGKLYGECSGLPIAKCCFRAFHCSQKDGILKFCYSDFLPFPHLHIKIQKLSANNKNVIPLNIN